MKFSYHNHSLFSDGNDSIEDIVNYAKGLNLRELGISDHFCVSDEAVDKFDLLDITMPKNRLDEYLEQMQKQQEKFLVKIGLEVDYIEGFEDAIKKELRNKPFDYLIGSVHFFEKIAIDKKNAAKGAFTDNACKRYWQLVQKMAKSRLFDIAAHLDLMKKYGNNFKEEHSKEILEAVKEIKAADMVIELNTSGWFRNCKEQYPSQEILKMIKELDIPVIITADAHRKENLIREFDKARLLLKELGFTKTALFTKRKKEIVSL